MTTTEKLRRWKLLATKRAELLREALADLEKTKKDRSAWAAANHRQIGVIQRYRAALKECQRLATVRNQPRGNGHFGIGAVARAALEKDK